MALVVDDTTYRIWLEPLRALELSDGRLTIGAPGQAAPWVRERFGRVLSASIELVLGDGIDIEVLAAAEQDQGRPRGTRPHERAGRGDLPQSSHGAVEASASGLGNPKLTFEQFVIGDSNRLAHAAALAVTEMPAQAYNPLFICGPPGVGKTHLLCSIANLLTTHHPGLRARLATAEGFTNEFRAALVHGHAESFKRRFRDVDVLLIDDVQFLERKAKTEEEFFHTFNALHDRARQIVLSSDRPPRDLQDLEDRLRERFEAGLVADIALPDLPTRLAILRKRAHQDELRLEDEQPLHVIAERVRSHVRALEGALIRTVAFSSLTGRPLSAELAHEVLDRLYHDAHKARRCTIAEIQSATCEHFGISAEELLSSTRAARVAWPRQVAMYLARELTSEPVARIGRDFGGRDHTTVLHACKKAAARIESGPEDRDAVEKLRSVFDGRS